MRILPLVALVGALALVASACGGDDDDFTTEATDVHADATNSVADGTASPGTPASVPSNGTTGDTVAVAGPVPTTATPDSGAPEQNPCAPGGTGTLGPVEPPAAGAEAVTVGATEYTFGGLDALDHAADYAITLSNGGKELHELTIVRIDDDETRPIDQLLNEPDPSAFATTIATTFACTGATAEPAGFSLDQPGRYAAVCFIPTGATAATAPADFDSLGPPHALEGMAIEFTIA